VRHLIIGIVATAAMTSSPIAVAEPLIGFEAQLGASVPQRDDDTNAGGLANSIELTLVAPAVAVAVAYRATDQISVGARVGATRLQLEYERYSSGGRFDFERYQLIPLDVSLIVRYEEGRTWVAPWLGWRFTRVVASRGERYDGKIVGSVSHEPVEWTSSSFSAGVVGGYKVWSRGHQHLGPFLEISGGQREHGGGKFSESAPRAAVTLGLTLQR